METMWTGAYSFKLELGSFLKMIREQIDLILEKIEKADKLAAR